MNHIEYLFEHGLIGADKRQLNEDNSEGMRIAKALGVRFLGFWAELGKYIFNDDDDTGTSFVAKDIDEARKKLQQKRKEFAVAYG
jgi:hypothetical protein